jgi:uncharacterized protein (DUF2267 family)
MVAEEAGIDRQDASELITEFLTTIQGYIPPVAWEILNRLAPQESRAQPQSAHDNKSGIREFLLDLAGEEEVQSRRSASHARAVAMSLHSKAAPSEVQILERHVPEDLLALFEIGSRGELTSTEPRRDQVD